MKSIGSFILGVSITLNVIELYYILKNRKKWENKNE